MKSDDERSSADHFNVGPDNNLHTSNLGGGTNTSQYYKKSQKISKKAFKDLFAFDENDRTKK